MGEGNGGGGCHRKVGYDGVKKERLSFDHKMECKNVCVCRVHAGIRIIHEDSFDPTHDEGKQLRVKRTKIINYVSLVETFANEMLCCK